MPKLLEADVAEADTSDQTLVAGLVHSGQLAGHLTWRGLGEFAVVFTLVWIAWTNGSLHHELHGHDDARARSTFLLQILVLAAMGAFIPQASGARGAAFAVTAAVLFAVLAVLWLLAARGDRPEYRRPRESVIRRHVGVDPIPATAWATAVSAGRTPEESRTDEQQAALALAAPLTDELIAADALLFAVPLYNFGVSQHFKTWVDMVITDPRMAAGTQPILAGQPAVLVTVRGGNYRSGTPREGWDHATGWMRRILGDVWHLDLKVVEAEFTLVGVNPALDQFTDLARQLRQEAEEQARRHGRELGAAVATAPPKAA